MIQNFSSVFDNVVENSEKICTKGQKIETKREKCVGRCRKCHTKGALRLVAEDLEGGQMQLAPTMMGGQIDINVKYNEEIIKVSVGIEFKLPDKVSGIITLVSPQSK